MKLLQLVHSVPAKAAPFSIAVAISDTPMVAAASADDQIPVLPLVLVAAGLRGLVYVGNAALKLRFSQLVQQTGVFVVGETYPAISAKPLFRAAPRGSGRGSAGLFRRELCPIGSWRLFLPTPLLTLYRG